LTLINKVEDEEFKSFLCEYRWQKVLIFRFNVKENCTKYSEIFVKDALEICKIKPNQFLLKCLGMCLTKEYFYLMFENIEDTKDLKTILMDKEGIKIPIMKKINIISQVAHGIHLLSAYHLYHSDLRTINVLVSTDLKNLEVRLINYGMTNFNAALGRKLKLTNIAYIDPDLLRNDKCEKTTDMYSFGILMWETFTRDRPFSKNSKLNVLKDSIINKGNRPDLKCIPSDVPEELIELIKRCWGATKNRPNINEVVFILDNEFNIE
jgi:serine/threonine protein kinase